MTRVTALISADDNRSQTKLVSSSDDDMAALQVAMTNAQIIVKAWRDDGCYAKSVEFTLTEEDELIDW